MEQGIVNEVGRRAFLKESFPPRGNSKWAGYYSEWYKNPTQAWTPPTAEETTTVTTPTTPSDVTPPTAPPVANEPRTMTKDGYVWQYISNPLDPTQGMWDVVGQTREGSQSPSWSERMQANQWGDTFAQNQKILAAQRSMSDIANFNQMLGGGQITAGERNWQQTEANHKAWEEWRQEIIGNASPAQWVETQNLKNMANPYENQELSTQERVANAEQTLSQAEKAAKQVEARQKDPQDPLNIANPVTPQDYAAKAIIDWRDQTRQVVTALNASLLTGQQQAVKNAQGQTTFVAPENEDLRWSTPQPTGDGNFSVGRPSEPTYTGVETPEWLKSYVPNINRQVAGKNYISGTGNIGGSKMQATPLSQWSANRLAPSQMQQLAGYQNWAGGAGSVSDWANQTSQMNTRNLSLGRNWKSSMQV